MGKRRVKEPFAPGTWMYLAGLSSGAVRAAMKAAIERTWMYSQRAWNGFAGMLFRPT